MDTYVQDGKAVVEIDVMEAQCVDCDVIIGPDNAEAVAVTVMNEHANHGVEIEEYTETNILPCPRCGDDATHFEEVHLNAGRTTMVPFCESCGNHA